MDLIATEQLVSNLKPTDFFSSSLDPQCITAEGILKTVEHTNVSMQEYDFLSKMLILLMLIANFIFTVKLQQQPFCV